MSTPLHALNDDVLACIFAFNGDMFTNDTALDTTRIASQVCHQWRDLILESSCLWGKLIDVDHIHHHRSNEWRDELIRRSGTAPLWIKATYPYSGVGPLGTYPEVFFFKLITGNWHRIQKLVISPYSKFSLPRSLLTFPAPKLEHCEAPYVWVAAESQNKDDPVPLFADHVPMLHSIYICREYLDLQAPWLCRLRSLVLDDSYSIIDALTVLSATRRLQDLVIEDISDGDITGSHPTVFLGCLKSLELHNHTMPGIKLLNHIEIPIDCSLTIKPNKFYSSISFSDHVQPFVSMMGILIQHAKRSLEARIVNEIDINYVRRDHMSLTFYTSLPLRRLVCISVPLRGNSDASVLESFLMKLLLLDFASVTKLKFTSNSRLHRYLGPFFSQFRSVDVISTDLSTLSHLARLQKKFIKEAKKKATIMFPTLEVIDLSICSSLQSISSVNRLISTFLQFRVREGHPITTLDMSNYFPFHTTPDFMRF